MGVGEAFRSAVQSLWAHRLRSGLTMLGLIIGVGAVIIIAAIGQGVQSVITAQLSSVGTNLVFVSPGTTKTNRGVAAQAPQTITYDDAKAIADPANVPSAALVSPEASSFGQLIHGAQNTVGQISGVVPEYGAVHDYTVSQGDWISPEQLQAVSNVVVLGASVAQTLFGQTNPIGQLMRVSANGGNAVSLTVIGVGASKGGSGFNNSDNAVFVPLTTMLKKINRQVSGTGAQTVNLIAVQAVDAQHINSLQQELTALLLQRHHIKDPANPDFSVTSLQDVLTVVTQVTALFTIFLSMIAGISLLVGGIGIMNIMIVSVTERTREIGIRKAVGARRRDILVQFLVESVLVSLLGGLGGVLIGFIAAHFGSNVQVNGSPFQMAVTAQSVILATGVSCIIGIFFGFYPAMRAARLNPIDALRYE